ncbi:nuclear transport factor 2 family protein [Litoribacter populi]|uniref:nuclear transport factor 2 family protein n=1 Tax=Litoribacter populi TaxID=2598460 RepID=UPI00117C4BB1|nr:nuclear transport factor 2 family protein [Litoribacter populi]
MQEREAIIRNYVEGYNNFDVPQMTQDFSEDIIFENIQNGELTMSLRGKKDFSRQAEQATSYFSERHQRINKFRHEETLTEIGIEYYAVVASNLPNGLSKGQELKLNGKSVFKFDGLKIVKLTDVI